jgi:lysyl-tRNA synthetase, class II
MIVTEETRNTLRARSRIVSTIRRMLEDRDFLEVACLLLLLAEGGETNVVS